MKVWIAPFLFFVLFLRLSGFNLYAATKGEEIFINRACWVCHGKEAQGNKTLGAPSLAGQDQVYLERQLHNFNVGIRGYHPKDIFGKAMRQMAIFSQADRKEVAIYLNQLKPTSFSRTVVGSAAKGQAVFATCAACHGPDARGMPQMNAPSLVILNDWYLENQILSFKHGWRANAKAAGVKANEEDQIGAAMPPMVQNLSTEEIKNLIAYIYSLRFQKK